MILVNKAKCLLCGDIIESKYTHNYVVCRCGKLAVDGGTEYLKRSFTKMEDWEDLSEGDEKK